MNEQSLFAQVLDIPDPAERAALLDRACGDNSELRRRLERLLERHRDAGSFLERPALAPEETLPFETATEAEPPGTVIGPYKLLEAIGEGGMGVVYMAEQTAPVRRRVALKIIKPGMDSRQVVARFEAERQALALMDHTNIAKVHDGGATDSGRPYFVMELVRGLPITEYCDQARLSVPERLGLFVQVCRAVQHAHLKGVIHRDIKPSNILVTEVDGAAVPKVIDFGIAKATGGGLTDRTLFTGFHQLVGTPLYMSPEQAALSGVDVDTRSDVYSLGVLLYELLTGTTPFDPETLRRAGLDEMRRILREDEPPRPSRRVSTLAAALSSTIAERRKVDPRRLGGLMRSELDWVVMRALEKDRNRRYESASTLAADIERYLAGAAVEAAPPSTVYRLRKVARRNRAALVTAAIVAGVLIAGTTVSTWQAVRATRAERETAAALTDARRQRQQARQAVDDMYTQVAEKWLAQQGSLTAVQKDFLEKALVFYQEFAAESVSDPQDRYEELRALDRVGSIQYQLRRLPEAEASFLRLITRGADMAGEHPDRPEFLVEVGYGRVNLAKTYRATGREKKAEHVAVLANNDLRAVQSNSLDDRGHLQRLAMALGELGGELALAHWLPEADAAVRAALEVWEALVAGFPSEFDYRYGLAKCFERQGVQRMWWGIQKVEAGWSLREAESRLTALLKEQPGHVAARRTLGLVLGNQAVIVSWLKRYAEAEALERRSLALQERLAAEFPDSPSDQRSLVITLDNLGTSVGTSAGRGLEAEEYTRRAAGIAERLADRYPDDLEFSVMSLDMGMTLGVRLERNEKHEECRRILERTVLKARELVKAHRHHDPF